MYYDSSRKNDVPVRIEICNKVVVVEEEEIISEEFKSRACSIRENATKILEGNMNIVIKCPIPRVTS